MEITIRTADPSDAEAILKCYTAPLAARNTLQIPYRGLESVREQLTKSGAGDHLLVAEIEGEVVGVIGLHTSSRPRVNHRAEVGMMVRDDWQGKGVGAALMQAVIELADKWLNLTRIELTVLRTTSRQSRYIVNLDSRSKARFASMRSVMESSSMLSRWRELNENVRGRQVVRFGWAIRSCGARNLIPLRRIFGRIYKRRE